MKTLAEQIRELDAKASKDWRVYLCGESRLPETGEACGITCHSDHPAHVRDNGGRGFVVRDESYDECHHPATSVDMELAVLLRNNAELIAKALEALDARPEE